MYDVFTFEDLDSTPWYEIDSFEYHKSWNYDPNEGLLYKNVIALNDTCYVWSALLA